MHFNSFKAQNILTTSIYIAGLSLLLNNNVASAANIFGFSGSYAPADWSFTNINSDGSVNLSSIPNSLTLTGGDNQSGNQGFTEYLTTAQTNAVVSFDWSYTTSDQAGLFDPFLVYQSYDNSYTVELSNPSTTSSSGNYSFQILQGDKFGFMILTEDNNNGAAQAVISNFSISTIDVPEPSLIAGTMLTAGLLCSLNKKQKR